MIRTANRHEYAMAEPTFFAIEYAINPWMDPSHPADSLRAMKQWDRLRQTFLDLGHKVNVIEPLPGLPDMVFAANGGFTLDGHAYCAKFAYAEREPEEPAFARWFHATGLEVHRLENMNEGEGDFLLVGPRILAASPYRTDPAAHAELASLTGREVLSLELADPRFYHLDTALAVLDDEFIAYFPPAFSAESQAALAGLYPDALIVAAADAGVLGLNVVSDGRHVVMTEAAPGFAAQLREAGFEPIELDVSEFLLSGGSAKCCTLEVRR